MSENIALSFCTYQSGDFDVMIRDRDTGREFCFSGNQRLDADALEFVDSIAPACVWTNFTRTTAAD